MKLTLEIDCSSEELQWLKNEIIDLCNEEIGHEPVFLQTDVVRQSEPLPPSNCYDPICSSCKQPMDEDEGRWGICNDCIKET